MGEKIKTAGKTLLLPAHAAARLDDFFNDGWEHTIEMLRTHY